MALTTIVPECAPGRILAERGRFQIRIAADDAEVRLAQRLRYDVFHREQGRGAENGGELDVDRFDEQFTHLLVVDREARRVVGTYRMQSGNRALEAGGFYSSAEYEITGLRRYAGECWELGRSCVAPEYRSGAVIALLWAGIAAMRQIGRFRYLIGCGSCEAMTPETGWALYDRFSETGALTDEPYGIARGAYKLPEAAAGARERLRREPETLARLLPPLFKGYLHLGAKIASEPAWDREFGTLDFLIWFDFEATEARYRRHFGVESE